jgi:hypothetical protein
MSYLRVLKGQSTWNETLKSAKDAESREAYQEALKDLKTKKPVAQMITDGIRSIRCIAANLGMKRGSVLRQCEKLHLVVHGDLIIAPGDGAAERKLLANRLTSDATPPVESPKKWTKAKNKSIASARQRAFSAKRRLERAKALEAGKELRTALSKRRGRPPIASIMDNVSGE